MHSAFQCIEYGPFAAPYHRGAVNDDFKEALSAFLEAQLLPQVDEPFDTTRGRSIATYDDPKHCGPRSAVRDIYDLEFEFVRSSGTDMIKTQLVFDPVQRNFTTRHRMTFVLWTTARLEQHQQKRKAIQKLCRRIATAKLSTAVCPLCSARLQISDSPGLFDVRCSRGCFNYNFHRDPKSGAFLHGHIFLSDSPDATFDESSKD